MTTYLITGAGSLGACLITKLLKDELNKIRVLDSSEHALATMKLPYPSLVRKLLGSITDKDRIRRAVHGVDIVIHTAALKNLDITEFNTSELIKTNIVGTDNVISAAVEAGVKKIMFISSDKSVEPTSIYGASKLLGEHTALNYNSPFSRVSIFRSGNFMKSNGNALEMWKDQLEQGQPLTITDIKCMRYFIDTDLAAKTILKCISKMIGGEIFIPSETIMPELSIMNLAKNLAKTNDVDNNELSFYFTGLRKGEKLSESLFTVEESTRKVYDKELNCYIINSR